MHSTNCEISHNINVKQPFAKLWRCVDGNIQLGNIYKIEKWKKTYPVAVAKLKKKRQFYFVSSLQAFVATAVL